MKNFKSKPERLEVVAIGMSLLAVSLLLGCTPTKESGGPTDSKLPKLYLHCPSKYPACIERLRELFNSVVKEGNLPAAKEIEVLEVIHGTGAAAHSHYYLANQEKDDHYLEEESSDEKIHVLSIDVFTEIRDIAWTLPKVATNSDMEEADWLVVKEASEGLVAIMEQINSGEAKEDQRRVEFKRNQAEIDRFLQQLEKRVEASGN